MLDAIYFGPKFGCMDSMNVIEDIIKAFGLGQELEIT